MIWLALRRSALAKPIGEVSLAGVIGFFAAAGFQWVNPKAWMIALSALAAHGGGRRRLYEQRSLHRCAQRLDADPLLGEAWTLFDASLSRLLMDPKVTRPFNWTMAALLVASCANPVRIGAPGEPAIAAEFHHHPLPAGGGCAPARTTFEPSQETIIRRSPSAYSP